MRTSGSGQGKCAWLLAFALVAFSPGISLGDTRILLLPEEAVPVASSQAIQEELRGNGFTLVLPEKINELVITPEMQSRKQRLFDVQNILEAAEGFFLDFDFSAAEENYVRARNICETFAEDPALFTILLKTYIRLAEVYDQQGRDDFRDLELRKALVLQPKMVLDKAEFAPEFLANIERVRSGLVSAGYGTLNVQSLPEGAKVSLNGFPLCNTPCLLQNILSGAHYLRIKAHGYRAHWQRFDMAGGAVLPISVRLPEKTGIDLDGHSVDELILADKDKVREPLLALGQGYELDFVVRIVSERIQILQMSSGQWQEDLPLSEVAGGKALVQRLNFKPVAEPKKVESVAWYSRWQVQVGVGMGILAAGLGTYYLLQEPTDVIHGSVHP
ncbi:MAG: hypothetical protein CMH60_03240 [Myxococcales bacterium]|nr:hypothetical protein [Myxococcales bacterium]